MPLFQDGGGGSAEATRRQLAHLLVERVVASKTVRFSHLLQPGHGRWQEGFGFSFEL